MAQAVLMGPDWVELRRAGMPAPKRPEEIKGWWKNANKAVKREWSKDMKIPAHTFSADRILFELPGIEGWLLIDRKANALGRD